MTYRNTKFWAVICFALVSSVGLAHAEMDGRDVVRDVRGAVVHSTNGNCVRTQWTADGNACPAQPQRADLPRERRTVYFDFGKATLSSAAKKHLNTLIQDLKAIPDIQEVQIVGYADRIGDVTSNEKLSKKRAEAVKKYLLSKGYTKAGGTSTRWVGESQPSTNCPKKEVDSKLIKCLQNDRRAEVMIIYAP